MIERDGNYYTCELSETDVDITNIFERRIDISPGSIILAQKFNKQNIGSSMLNVINIEKIYRFGGTIIEVTFTFDFPRSDDETKIIEFVNDNLHHFDLKVIHDKTSIIFNLVQTESIPLKIFLSHQMSGLSDDLVKIKRDKAKEYLKQKYGCVEIIDNYNHLDAPENAGRLWHLGRSIQQMEEANAIYFCDGFQFANGCLIELMIAKIYNIKIIE